jgi:hypothetical protein
MKSIARTNLFAHVDFGYNVFELSVAKHANIDMLNSKYLARGARKRGETNKSIRITLTTIMADVVKSFPSIMSSSLVLFHFFDDHENISDTFNGKIFTR